MSILTYHMVDNRFDWGVTRVTPKQFKRQVNYLVENDYTVQTLSDYITASDMNSNQKRVCITFDDAYDSVYKWAFPIMAEFGVRGTLFIISGYVGKNNSWDVNLGWKYFKHLDWRQINLLINAGWEIGSHTVSHRDLTLLTPSELKIELELSKSIIEKKSNQKINIISYPFGKVNANVTKAVQSADYHYGVKMDMNHKNLAPQYCIPRIGVYLFDSIWTFKQKVDEQNQWFHKIIQRAINFCSTGSIIVKEKL